LAFRVLLSTLLRVLEFSFVLAVIAVQLSLVPAKVL